MRLRFRSTTAWVAVALGLGVVVCGACVGDEPSVQASNDGGADGGTDAASGDGGGDSGAGAPCDPTMPFTTLTEVDGVNTPQNEGSPSLSTDERTLYFNAPTDRATGAGDFDLYVATRENKDGRFGPATPVSALLTGNYDGDAFLSADGKLLFFSSNGRDGGLGGTDVWLARRGSESAPFEAPVLVTGASTQLNDGQISITADKQEMFFVGFKDADASTDLDILSGTYNDGTAAVSNPAPEALLNSSDGEIFPVVSGDGLVIYFASTRTGAGGPGGRVNVWRATRSGRMASFSAPAPVPDVNSDVADTTPRWLSPDLCRLYLTRNPGPSGKQDLMVATRTPP